jgi:hypothetical protein
MGWCFDWSSQTPKGRPRYFEQQCKHASESRRANSIDTLLGGKPRAGMVRIKDRYGCWLAASPGGQRLARREPDDTAMSRIRQSVNIPGGVGYNISDAFRQVSQ